MRGRILPGVCTTNRNLAIFENLIIDTSVDEYVFALDAQTGELVWETQILDYRTHPANQSTGPIIANGKVISGRSCMPAGGPEACVITAHDARTGAELWRRRTTPVSGFPVTYAVNGRQYVVAGTGTGGNASRWLTMTPELRPSGGNNLFVFALP